ncbi:unnamed protein product [Heterobilharzia americana]|nr:unnamed protein product [Heterobilharzia americana]
MTSHPLIEAGSTVMLRAIELEKQLKLTESLVCYQESIGLFIKALRSLSGNTQLEFKERLKQKVSEYMTHAEKLKDKLKQETAIVVRSESNVKNIYLTTGEDAQNPNEQLQKFQMLKDDLNKHSVCFQWIFSNLLHDREIRFDNGWIVKIGRGLDYIRRSEHKFCGLGVHDYEFRRCSATTIDIFHSSVIL